MRKPWGAHICAVLLAGCACQAGSLSPAQPPVRVAPAPRIAGDPAELYVFNTSGWTLIPSNQDVCGNGKVLASLPRLTYTIVRIPPGAHDLRLHGRQLVVNAEEGKKYFVKVGYRPERWRHPVPVEDTVEIRQITEDEARLLMQQLTAR